MLRLATLNVGHRTQVRAVGGDLLDALAALDAEVLVLTEIVVARREAALRERLAAVGYAHVACSPGVEYARSRWHNQVLVASRSPVTALAMRGAPAPDACGDTNLLAVRTCGVSLTGVRAPAYVRAGDWRAYWAWLSGVASTDVVIGDLNVDPCRAGPRDRVLDALMRAGGWQRAEVEGAWSWCGPEGRRASLDHALVRAPLDVVRARYVASPFAPRWTDHAALVVEVRQSGDGGRG